MALPHQGADDTPPNSDTVEVEPLPAGPAAADPLPENREHPPAAAWAAGLPKGTVVLVADVHKVLPLELPNLPFDPAKFSFADRLGLFLTDFQSHPPGAYPLPDGENVKVYSHGKVWLLFSCTFETREYSLALVSYFSPVARSARTATRQSWKWSSRHLDCVEWGNIRKTVTVIPSYLGARTERDQIYHVVL